MSISQSNFLNSRSKIIFFGSLHVLAWCVINALLALLSCTYLFKTKFIKSLEFIFPVQIGSLNFEIPHIKKKFIPLIFILGISAVISKIAVDCFEVYKLEYKNILADQKLIKKPDPKNQSDAKSDLLKALGIVFFYVSIRNFLREPREISQLLFNNIKKLDLSWIRMVFLSLLIFSIIIILTFIDKYSKRKENNKCDNLLRKEVKKEEQSGKPINFISLLKRKTYRLEILKKEDTFINEIICITISVIPALITSKIFFDYGILQNIKLTFNVSDAFFSFVDNSTFLLTNIFFEFFFASLIASFLFTDNPSKTLGELKKISDEIQNDQYNNNKDKKISELIAESQKKKATNFSQLKKINFQDDKNEGANKIKEKTLDEYYQELLTNTLNKLKERYNLEVGKDKIKEIKLDQYYSDDNLFYYGSLKIIDKKRIRTIFVCGVNALLFAVGLGSTILIEKFISGIEKFNNFFDMMKVLCALTIGYAMIVSAYTIPKTICEIQDAKEEFNKEQKPSFPS